MGRQPGRACGPGRPGESPHRARPSARTRHTPRGGRAGAGGPTMSCSEKKRAANRANAQQSTGPRSAEGKAAASRNAVTHGLSAAAVVLPGEDPAAFDAYAAAVVAELRPAGVLQTDLAREVAVASWKLRRVPGAERILFNAHGGRDRGNDAEAVVAAMIWAGDNWANKPN